MKQSEFIRSKQAAIQDSVCEVNGIGLMTLKKYRIRRDVKYSLPRHEIHYFSRILLKKKHDDIGKIFTKDRTTVMNSVIKVEGWQQVDSTYKEKLNEIQDLISEKFKLIELKRLRKNEPTI